MPECSISWNVEVDADTPVHAAFAALAFQRDPTPWATVFTVTRTTVTWSSTSTPTSWGLPRLSGLWILSA
ncbi:hypothetical protein [Streptomyces sp. NPDC055912]|uniref:hypothetical protein n=1 Tax=Streptomyces sp. NPDC055912 TaxID=3345660 RepID=UPI0035E27D9F